MSLPPIFLFTGTPGAGKTTLSRALLRRYPKSIHLPVDDVRDWVVSGIATTFEWTDETERQFRLAEESCAEMAKIYQAAGFAVAIDHCRRYPRLNELFAAKLADVPCHRIAVLCDLETALHRNATRTGKNFDPAALEPAIRTLQPVFADVPEDWISVENANAEIEEVVADLLNKIGPG